MTEIQIAVRSRIPSVTGDVTCIVADNSDYTIRFSFDDQWTDGEKTVYFVLDSGYAYPPVKITGDTVEVPRLEQGGFTRRLYVGVSQGDLITTCAVGLNVHPSITDLIDDRAVQPEPALWENLLARMKQLEQTADASEERITEAVNHYLEENPVTPVLPGNGLELKGGTLNVLTTDTAEPGNNLPITSAGGHIIAGKIDGLADEISYDADKWGEATISKTTVFGVESGNVVWENGYINASSGTVYSKTDTNWWHTPDYIPVRDSDVIQIKNSIISHSSVAMIAAYDANNAYLSEKSVKLAKGDSTYTVPEDDGIAFVRFTLGNGTNYELQEIHITAQAPITTPKENIDHIYERLGVLDNTVKLYANSMPLVGKTVFLAGDSRSSTDYTFYKTLLEEKCGCLALNQGASGRTAAYNASDAYFDRLVKNEHDFSIWLVGGNDNGASGNIGTFDANSVNGKAGESVVEETDISVDYAGTKFVQAIDHIMRKYKAMFYNFKKLGNRRFPRMIFCTDLPQQRSNASSSWSQKANWERKRNAIIECCEKNGIPCLDLYKLCGFDMAFEPYWTEPTDKKNDNGLYFMDGLHPNQYGMDLVTSLEIEEMKKYIMTTDYIKPWTMAEDGLIMYCDGINNTGNGHDANVTTWTDLSGNGNDLINVSISSATTPATSVKGEWLENGMHVINKSNQFLRTVNTFDLGADRTVEFRLTMNADANMTIGLYYADRLKLRSGGSSFWARFGQSESTSTYDVKPGKPSRYNVPFTVTMTRHYDADADTTTHRVYVDGIFYAEKSWAGNLRAGETAHVYIGSESTNVTVHTVRIYNRALTDEEVKSNYWYDEAHFAEGGAE